MKTVKNILQSKQSGVYAVARDTTVLEALKVMMDKNISALLVIEDEELLGIFTERDYARKVALQGRSSKDTTIQEIMTANPRTISQEDSIESCMRLMTVNHFRHLPIVSEGKVIGMISIGDVVKFIIEDQQQTIDHLQSYIHS